MQGLGKVIAEEVHPAGALDTPSLGRRSPPFTPAEVCVPDRCGVEVVCHERRWSVASTYIERSYALGLWPK